MENATRLEVDQRLTVAAQHPCSADWRCGQNRSLAHHQSKRPALPLSAHKTAPLVRKVMIAAHKGHQIDHYQETQGGNIILHQPHRKLLWPRYRRARRWQLG
jgi:hypothetical protein